MAGAAEAGGAPAGYPAAAAAARSRRRAAPPARARSLALSLPRLGAPRGGPLPSRPAVPAPPAALQSAASPPFLPSLPPRALR